MQTHEDQSHGLRRQFLEKLRERANDSQTKGDGQIAAGAPGEQPIAAWKASNGLHVRHMQDDEQGILRISVGGGEQLPVTLNYCTIRGPVGQCIELLEKAIQALKESPE